VRAVLSANQAALLSRQTIALLQIVRHRIGEKVAKTQKNNLTKIKITNAGKEQVQEEGSAWQ